MRIGGVMIYFFLFFFCWGEFVCSSQMSMKSHRDIMKLSKRPLDVVFFQSVWPRCVEIGHFIRWNFSTWSCIKWIENQIFKPFDLSFLRYLPSIFIVFWLCVSTNHRLHYSLILYQPPRSWTLHSENCAVYSHRCSCSQPIISHLKESTERALWFFRASSCWLLNASHLVLC